MATTALVGAIFAITKATALLNAALAVRAALSGPVGWAALGVAAGVGVGAYAISGGFGDQADEAESETARLADAQQETADLLGRSTGPGSAPQPVRDRDLIAEYGDDKQRLENILAGLDCEISRLKEGPEVTPAPVQLNSDEDLNEFFNPNAGVSQRQVNAAIKQGETDRVTASLAEAADRRERSAIDEFRALSKATGVTAGHLFPARQLMDPETGVGDLSRIPERDLQRAIIEIRSAFPDEVEGVPPRVQAGAQYSRGDTSNTFYIDGSDDPEMTAAAVMRQLNRQADQDHW